MYVCACFSPVCVCFGCAFRLVVRVCSVVVHVRVYSPPLSPVRVCVRVPPPSPPCPQSAVQPLFRERGEALLRLSESKPGALALFYLPLGTAEPRIKSCFLYQTINGSGPHIRVRCVCVCVCVVVTVD